MRTLSISPVIATLSLVTSLFSAELPVQVGRDSPKTPEGLSGPDWSGIRGAYEKNRHAIVANPDGSHQSRNPRQAWLTKFDGRGFTVVPDAGGWCWGLELQGYGEVTQVRQDGAKISYTREDGLTEWFVNDARGLEQGWTLAKRPDRAEDAGPISLRLAIRGSLRPQVSEEGTSVSFQDQSGGAALTYGGLKAWDADGKPVHVRFAESEAGHSGICVVVDDTGATYPITIDPIAQQASLKASNTGAGDSFGYSVAVSGNTVVVGAIREDSRATGVNGNQADNSATDSGAAYVFVRSGTTWSQQAYLKASNTGANDWFGFSVAISGDTVVVGVTNEDSNAAGVNGNQSNNLAANSGAAYVFVRNGTTWSQQAYLKASNSGTGDLFGRSVALSANTVVVGANLEASSASGVNANQADNSAAQAGAAYVFVRRGVTWSQQAYLKASNAGVHNPDWFGYSVAVSGDTVVVGAMWQDGKSTGVNGNPNLYAIVDSGAAYVFVRTGSTWSQQAFLKASNTGTQDFFGGSVGISGDTVVVGAASEDSGATKVNGNQGDDSAPDAGAAYVFVRSGATWRQQAYLKASNAGAGDNFGQFVAISGDAVIVGAAFEDSNATEINGNEGNNSASNSGATYLFVRSGTTWNQQAYLKASTTAADDHFGQSVAISGDTMVVGAAGEDSKAIGENGNQADNSATDSGAVSVMVTPDSPLVSTEPNPFQDSEVASSTGVEFPTNAIVDRYKLANPSNHQTALAKADELQNSSEELAKQGREQSKTPDFISPLTGKNSSSDAIRKKGEDNIQKAAQLLQDAEAIRSGVSDMKKYYLSKASDPTRAKIHKITSKDGRKIEAKIIASVENGFIIQKTDGGFMAVDMNQLTDKCLNDINSVLAALVLREEREQAEALRKRKADGGTAAIDQSKSKTPRICYDFYMKGYNASDPEKFEAQLQKRFAINEGSSQGEMGKTFMMNGVQARLAGRPPDFEPDNDINGVHQTLAQQEEKEAKERLRKEQAMNDVGNVDFKSVAESMKIMREVAESLGMRGQTAATFAANSVEASIRTRAALEMKGITVTDFEAAKITLASALLSANSGLVIQFDGYQYAYKQLLGDDMPRFKSLNIMLSHGAWNPQLDMALEHAAIIKNTDMLSGVAHLLVRGGGTLEEKFAKFLDEKEGKIWKTKHRLGEVSAVSIVRDLTDIAKTIGGTPNNAMNIMVSVGIALDRSVPGR